MADSTELNILGVQQLVSSKLNKTAGGLGEVEGVHDQVEDALSLSLSDEELLALARQWEADYKLYEAKIKVRQDANLTYYLGRQKEGGSQVTTDGQPISANILFEAEETFIPAVLAKNPEPVVWADNTSQGTDISNTVKTMLQYHADTLSLRRKLGRMVRMWSLDLLAVVKHGWDYEIEDITTDIRDVKKFVFDPQGFVDCFGDFEGALGERITKKASKIIELFPKHADYIKGLVENKLGTELTYTEWWNDDYCFYTLKDKVLDKNKNPYYNYPKDVPKLSLLGQPVLDEQGQPQIEETPGKNHFARPKKPYTFLSVFSIETQPHDITGLIEQNIPNQRRIARRTEQIDFNLTRQNNSDVFSGSNFNQETAKQAARAIAQGHPVIVPQGQPIDAAIKRLPGQGVDHSYFEELENSKNDLRSIFGTQGITATQPEPNETARGMILNNQYDSSRIGGGIGDALEQVAKSIFNYWTQIYYVFYDEPHTAAIMGQMKAVEFVTLSLQNLNQKLVVTVSPDSMKPKDEISEMNQAMSLWEAGALDPKTLFTILNLPDPQITAGQVMLYKMNPQMYMQLNFPDLVQEIQAMMPPLPPPGAPQAPPGGGAPPEAPTPPPTTAEPAANPSLSQVPISTQALPK